MLYYNTKTERFEPLTRKARSAHKILLTEELLRASITGEAEAPGHYWSAIGGIEFCWADLNETLMYPEADIRVYHPKTPDVTAYI